MTDEDINILKKTLTYLLGNTAKSHGMVEDSQYFNRHSRITQQVKL